MQKGFTWVLAERTRMLRYEQLPEDVREITRQCVLDWLAVAIAGSRSHLADLLVAQARAEGGHPIATLVGRQPRAAPLQVALVNGAASHVLDYDDVNTVMHGHPSAPILPALLALGQQRRSSGRELITSFVAGYEFACRVGQALSAGHYDRGFHATGTVGALGAAAACAHLLGLNLERTAHAIGAAATQAAGLRAMFGTECKPLHAGLAAQNGLRAAQLAAAGILARVDALECRVGFGAAMAPAFNADAGLVEPERFHLRDNLFKYHASCYATHPPIECVRRLREEHSLRHEDVERVIVRGERAQDTVCNIAEPRTALEMKFSLRFMTAAALTGADTAALEFFTDERAADPLLCSLRDKVCVELTDDWPMVKSEVVIETRDGRVLSAVHDSALPDRDIDRQGTRLAAKFERLVVPVLGVRRCGSMLERLRGLEHGTVDELMEEAAHAAGD